MLLVFTIVLLLILIGLISGMFMFWSLPTPQKVEGKQEIPFLSIIIPARNEAHRLPILLESLKHQNLKAYEVIVIDDKSDDQTVEVAKSYGAKVYTNTTINKVDTGKTIACANGARHAKGEWLLFLDADVKFEKSNSLEKLLSSYQKQKSKGILSIQPYHKVEKRYENLSAVFNIIVLTGVNVFTYWKSKFKTAGSFGPCILCDKESYLQTGGHAWAEESIMDDFALSKLFLNENLPVTNYGGRGIISLRMYSGGVRELIEGWTKNLAIASRSTHPFVMTLINLWIFGALLATSLPLVALLTGNVLFITLSLVGYMFYGIQTAVHAKRAGNFKKRIFLFYPVLFLFFIGVFIYSLYRTHILRSVMWKGRKIKV